MTFIESLHVAWLVVVPFLAIIAALGLAVTLDDWVGGE